MQLSNINIPSLNGIKCLIYVEYHDYIKDLGLEFLFAVLLMDGMGPRMLGKYCTTEHFKRERKKLAVFNKSRSVSLSVSLHLSICHSLHIHIYYIWYIITNYIIIVFWEFFQWILIIFTPHHPSQIHLFSNHLTLCPLFNFFLIYWVQFVLSIYFWMCDIPLECG